MDFGVLARHDRSNSWCKFPRTKCICDEHASRYERLIEDGMLSLSAIPEDHRDGDLLEINFDPADNKDASGNEKEEETLHFYNDDGSFQSVVVERLLCASDLCQVLALKNRLEKSVNWCIIEHWLDLGLERILEDHEYVLAAHRDIKNYSPDTNYRFIFRKEYRKYEFFHHPQQFFPTDMTALQYDNGRLCVNNFSLQLFTPEAGQCPAVLSPMWIRDQHTWSKAFVVLVDKKLYCTFKVHGLMKFVEATRSGITDKTDYGVRVLAKLADYQVYTTLNAKNQFRAPTEWGVCLRPFAVGADDDLADPGFLCLACDSEKVRSSWLIIMRLAKYGKQLRENYRAFKNKQSESLNPNYSSYTVPNESVRSRVAMDFTGSVGRIVDDPKEAKAIAVAEGYSWKRRWRPCRVPSSHKIQGIESGVHITQPWFHSGMSRDQATTLVSRHGTVDGVFLVRESRSHPGAFVLTYKFGGKVLHAQITPILDQVRDANVFSLDSGVTKFYDLLQLVEFYQLNAGCLPTRLTHYVVQSTNILNNSTNNANGRD